MSFALSRQLFVRLLGLVYLIAFASLGVQIAGLVGARGILPVAEFLSQAHSQYGARAYWFFPTLLWLSASDVVLLFLCWGGAALSILPMAGIAPAPALMVLWVFYLSVTVAGQIFLEFQWDALLLETGLLACLYAPLAPHGAGAMGTPPVRGDAEPNPIVRWVLGSLAFKLTFLSGVTKILSGDAAWANWTAMTYHYETQPIPAWTSWYAHQLPAVVHNWSVPVMLAIELVAPFGLFLPARFRQTRLLGCAAMIVLQVAIGATGNYGFFNLLTITLYLAALDDRTLQRLLRAGRQGPPRPSRREAAAWRLAPGIMAITIACVSLAVAVREMEITARGSTRVDGTWAGNVLRWVSPFRAVNGYGLFRVMTTARPEIVIEVSSNGRDWKESEFRWKAGDPMRRPRLVEPHMPRLDWQMWFAALDPGSAQYWLERLLQRILAGEPTVLRLLDAEPLPERPRFVRLAYYEYRFTTRAERAATGAWWNRTFLAFLTGPIRGAP